MALSDDSAAPEGGNPRLDPVTPEAASYSASGVERRDPLLSIAPRVCAAPAASSNRLGYDSILDRRYDVGRRSYAKPTRPTPRTMSRHGGLDWEGTNRASRQREASAREREADRRIYARSSERTEPTWYLRSMRYHAACDACGEEIIKGERAWMRRDSDWHFAHEACRE